LLAKILERSDSQQLDKNTTRKIGRLWSVTFRKSSKIGATRCNILKLKCIKFDLLWRLRPRPRWGSLQRSPDPLIEYQRGLLLREEEERERRKSRGKMERKRKRKGGKGGKERRIKGREIRVPQPV